MDYKMIYVSYNGRDGDVQPLPAYEIEEVPVYGKSPYVHATTVEDYAKSVGDWILYGKGLVVDGEQDTDRLAAMSEDDIRNDIESRMEGNGVNLMIVLISPGMYVHDLPENKQWIPWEISYALEKTKASLAKSYDIPILGLILPDKNGSCNYCTRDAVFPIMYKNLKELIIYFDEWVNFRTDPEKSIEKAVMRCGNAFKGRIDPGLTTERRK